MSIDRALIVNDRIGRAFDPLFLLGPETDLYGFDYVELPAGLGSFHAKESTEFVVGELIGVLVAHFLLDEFVPVGVGKRARADHELVPLTREVRDEPGIVLGRLIEQPSAFEFQFPGDFLLTLEDDQGHLNRDTSALKLSGENRSLL